MDIKKFISLKKEIISLEAELEEITMKVKFRAFFGYMGLSGLILMGFLYLILSEFNGMINSHNGAISCSSQSLNMIDKHLCEIGEKMYPDNSIGKFWHQDVYLGAWNHNLNDALFILIALTSLLAILVSFLSSRKPKKELNRIKAKILTLKLELIDFENIV